jgi:tartrate dehydrogenase/decarboxylase/D-malate dehydrogenase
MMLDHMKFPRAADRVRAAVRRVLASSSPRTPDLGGNAKTATVGRAVLEALNDD